MPRPQRIALTLLRPFMVCPERGAETPLYLATSPEVEGVTGRYFDRRGERAPDTLATDPGLAWALWERSAEMTGLG